MKKQTILHYILIISLFLGILALSLLIFLTKKHFLFISENNISDNLILYFQNFLIYGLLLDPIGWSVLGFLIVQFHKKNHDIQKTIIYALIQNETKKDLIAFWVIDSVCLLFSYNIIDNPYITITTELYVFIMTPFLTFHSIFYYLVKKMNLY